MLLYELNFFEMLEGSLSLLWVLFSTIVGVLIILKTKSKDYVAVGIFWIFMCGGWWASSIQFVFIISMDLYLPDEIYLLLTMLGIPWAVILWFYVFGTFVYPKKRKMMTIIYAIIAFGYQSAYIILVFAVPGFVGTRESIFSTDFSAFSLIFIIFGLSSVYASGLIFAKRSIQLNDPKVAWKGRFLLIAFTLYAIGAISDAALSIEDLIFNSLITIITRTLLVISGILFYFSFFLPDSLAKKLVKGAESS